jgi:ComF family protein
MDSLGAGSPVDSSRIAVVKAMPRHLWHRFRSWVPVVADTIFPARCYSCGRLFRRRPVAQSPAPDTEVPDGGLGAILDRFLCGTCRHLIQWIRSPLCTCCGRPFDAPHGVDHTCGDCWQNPGVFDRARAAAAYLGAFKALVCAYKYQCRVELAVPLSRILWQTLNRYWDLQQIDCMIPVPLHSRRLRQRGFNQAELMIRAWPVASRYLDRHPKPPVLWVDNLVRLRHTPPQIGLDPGQRVANMIDAFQLADPAAVRGSRVLLVDDVLTTGATVNACTRVLHRAKAASVEVLTLARA